MDKEQKLKKLKDLAEILDSKKSGTTELIILRKINELKDEVEKLKPANLDANFSSLEDRLNKLGKNITSVSEGADFSVNYFKQELRTIKNVISNLKLKKGENGKDGRDGKDAEPLDPLRTADLASKIALNELKPLIPEKVALPTPTEVIEQINEEKDTLIKREKVEGLEEIERKADFALSRPIMFGGGGEVLDIKDGTNTTVTKVGGIYRINAQSGGSSDYTPQGETGATVGGIPAGTDLGTTPVPVSDILDDMLYPTLYPTLTAPNNSFALTESGSYEVGATIATLHFTAGFSRGSISPAYGTSGYRSGLPNTYTYTGTGLTTPVSSTSLSDSQTVSSYVVLLGAQSWTNIVTYDAGEQPKDSVGNNYSTPLAAGTTGADSVSITGIFPYYWGVEAQALDVTTDGGGLTKVVSGNFSTLVKTYVTTNQVGYLCYPASYGVLTSVKDVNNFEVLSDWVRTTVTITNSYGEAVSCYRYEFQNLTTTSMQYTFYK